jgi:hypothetical protein
LGLDALVDRVIDGILEPLKLGLLEELGDVFDELANLDAARILRERALSVLRDVEADLPVDAVKTVRANAQPHTQHAPCPRTMHWYFQQRQCLNCV